MKKTLLLIGTIEKVLINLLDKYRKNNGEFDVVVPGSMRQFFVAHQLKENMKRTHCVAHKHP